MELKHSANGLIIFFINYRPVLNNGPKGLPRNPPDCIVLDNWVFESLISVDELFAKGLLQRFATYPSVNNNSCEKLILSSELAIIFEDNLKTTFYLLFTY